MKKQIAQLIILFIWLAIGVYGLFYHIPYPVLIISGFGWAGTLVAAIHWRETLSASNIYVKLVSLGVIGLMVIAAVAISYDLFDGIIRLAIGPDENIAQELAGSLVYSIATAMMVSIPIAVMFPNNYLRSVLFVNIPIVYIELLDPHAPPLETFNALIAFEIVARILLVWVGCVIASKALARDARLSYGHNATSVSEPD